ncbi:hypothetical protein GGX14DRAFT_581637 [Mycena pura]|uniref:Uncharacterized protein n=1 Tax=Mycena pura TaxID=153505 RepID=A0AAD6YUA3_9AGAR|nr:hypothetical protein GGX14DRAFT_581637 [Mycena pura]
MDIWIFGRQDGKDARLVASQLVLDALDGLADALGVCAIGHGSGVLHAPSRCCTIRSAVVEQRKVTHIPDLHAAHAVVLAVHATPHVVHAAHARGRCRSRRRILRRMPMPQPLAWAAAPVERLVVRTLDGVGGQISHCNAASGERTSSTVPEGAGADVLRKILPVSIVVCMMSWGAKRNMRETDGVELLDGEDDDVVALHKEPSERVPGQELEDGELVTLFGRRICGAGAQRAYLRAIDVDSGQPASVEGERAPAGRDGVASAYLNRPSGPREYRPTKNVQFLLQQGTVNQIFDIACEAADVGKPE